MALSDPQGMLASPFVIISCRDEATDIKAIINIVTQHQVNKIIVGLPRSMDGSVGRQAQKVKAFVDKLGEHTKVPIEFRDERLSTVAARRLMQATSGKKSRKKASDAIAAALILQGYLDEAPGQ